MDKDEVLSEIFSNDPFGILDIKRRASSMRTEDERLVASFEEINEFYKKNGRKPQSDEGNVQEFTLYSRLKVLRGDEDKKKVLEIYDKHCLLKGKKKEINSIDDILSDDDLGILESNGEEIFNFKHTPKEYERESADFVARRRPCKDFNRYKAIFNEVQKDLENGKRKLIEFNEENLREGEFYVHKGVLMLLEKINISNDEQKFSSGKRTRKDGRTRCLFENGTESNMLYRSVAKALYISGKIVTQNIDKVNKDFIVKFSNITDEDKEAGYIYVLKSKSLDEEITSIKNLFKIGYSKTDVQDRIKDAENEPTYLMAPVQIVVAFQCYNMNPQKLEQLLHNFFGEACLNIDVFDNDGNRHTPREWFIAPLEIIEQVVELIVNGEIIKYRYDFANECVVLK